MSKYIIQDDVKRQCEDLLDSLHDETNLQELRDFVNMGKQMLNKQEIPGIRVSESGTFKSEQEGDEQNQKFDDCFGKNHLKNQSSEKKVDDIKNPEIINETKEGEKKLDFEAELSDVLGFDISGGKENDVNLDFF